jgi:hypothetical protein
VEYIYLEKQKVVLFSTFKENGWVTTENVSNFISTLSVYQVSIKK